MLGKIKQIIKSLVKYAFSNIDQYRSKTKQFVIISNNCWGAEIYKALRRQYNTPFVGLFIHGPCYIKLLENFDHYMSQKLLFTNQSSYALNSTSYPIGLLGDVEVHFLHYKSELEARAKWDRRTARMLHITDKNQYFFKICDRDLTEIKIIERFHKLNYSNKISFGIAKTNLSAYICMTENENNLSVQQGFLLYQRSNHYLDIFEWIQTGKIKRTLLSRIKVLLKYS